MIKNYFTIAVRGLMRSKMFSFINIAGLAIGLTSFILIMLWVKDEWSYDRFHVHSDRLYRVMENQFYSDGRLFQTAQTPSPLAPALVQQFPEIEKAVRVCFTYSALLFDNRQIRAYEKNGIYADPDFFEIFSFPSFSGDALKALSVPNQIVLTKPCAEKYFGNEDPIGKVIRLNNQNDMIVGAVLQDIPATSHIKFDFIIPFEFLKSSNDFTKWGNNWHRTYVLVKPSTDPETLTKNIEGLIEKNNKGSLTKIFLQPLKDIYLFSDFNHVTPRITTVYTLSVIAVLVLLIACINFTNLSTARSIKRAREVGLRKVVGANRWQLIKQFLGESVFLSLLAFVLALLGVELLLPWFNQLTQKQIDFRLGFPQNLLLLSGIVIGTGIVAGLYPAFYLSSHSPVQVLKSQFQKGHEAVPLRKILVVVQFALSIALIISTFVVYRQLDYMQNKNLGYEKENILTISMRGKSGQHYEAFKNELLQQSDIANISAATDDITGYGSSTGDVQWRGKKPGEQVLITVTLVDYAYPETFGIKMKEGRSLSRTYSADSSSVMINETAVKAMNLSAPIGETLSFWDGKFTVIGVVQDYHFQSVHNQIEPLIIMLALQPMYEAVVRIKSDHLPATMASIEKIWQKHNPDYPLEYHFLDDDLDQLYRTEQRTSKIYTAFAALAIVISCLGLFGLASFTTEQRFKEIGVRKVLGASVYNIIAMLTLEFAVLVLISVGIASPAAYWLMSKWLENFAYRTDIGLTVFVTAGAGALIIAILTISFQAVKAATANPVEALKYE